MKRLIIILPLLLVGCWCKNPQTQTIESVVGCDTNPRSPNVTCLVKTIDGSTRKISQRTVTAGGTFTSCN